MGETMTTLADVLPREIERVIEVRKHYEELRSYPNVLVEPQIAMMTAAISEALRACASGDVIAMLRSYENLKGWVE